MSLAVLGGRQVVGFPRAEAEVREAAAALVAEQTVRILVDRGASGGVDHPACGRLAGYLAVSLLREHELMVIGVGIGLALALSGRIGIIHGSGRVSWFGVRRFAYGIVNSRSIPARCGPGARRTGSPLPQ